jgi:hypothetical protein
MLLPQGGISMTVFMPATTPVALSMTASMVTKTPIVFSITMT